MAPSALLASQGVWDFVHGLGEGRQPVLEEEEGVPEVGQDWDVSPDLVVGGAALLPEVVVDGGQLVQLEQLGTIGHTPRPRGERVLVATAEVRGPIQQVCRVGGRVSCLASRDERLELGQPLRVGVGGVDHQVDLPGEQFKFGLRRNAAVLDGLDVAGEGSQEVAQTGLLTELLFGSGCRGGSVRHQQLPEQKERQSREKP